MITNKSSTFLEVDPSILENNMMFTQKNEMEEKLLDILSSKPKPTKLITPYPGFCVKTFTKDQESKKIFMNICHTESIPSPKDISDEKLMEILSSDDPSTFRVPMSIGNPRTENDKSGLPATVYDIAINTFFLKKVEDNNLFKSFFLSVVFEGLQDKYQIEIDMEKYVVLKNRKSMGKLQNHSIEDRGQTIPKKNLIEEISEDTLSQKNTKPIIKEVKKSVEKLTFNTPEQTINSKQFEYRLIREPATGSINCVIAEFKIPNETKLRSLHLEVGEDRILLQDRDKISDLFVPFNIDQDKIHAILDRNNGILRVTMDAADPA